MTLGYTGIIRNGYPLPVNVQSSNGVLNIFSHESQFIQILDTLRNEPVGEQEPAAGGGVPSAADLVMAVYSGSGFMPDPNSAVIMANVNTAKLEYAPAISASGLELFFTRFDPGSAAARIYRTVRSGKTEAFGTPQLVQAIHGFIEGPAFSPDEKTLYYHRQNTSNG